MRLALTMAVTFTVLACEYSFDRATSNIGDRCRRSTCAERGADCGTIDDGCAGLLDCGTCIEPASCGGAGQANVCGCTPDCDDRCSGDNGCGGSCANSCALPETCGGGGIGGFCGCTPDCLGRCSGDDDCGGSCADDCVLPETCDGGGEAGYCGCTPACDGVCVSDDGCGASCPDDCVAPETCGGGGTPYACGCTPNCADRCGGDDGCGGTCAETCVAPETCGGGGTATACGCTPATCAGLLTAAGVACGTFDDGCGNTLLCDDACDGNQTCDVSTGTCCTPQCGSAECGADGCGGSCGACSWPELCGGDGNFSACSTGPTLCVADNAWCFEFPRPSGLAVNAVGASGASNAWFAGDAGTLVQWTGSALVAADANTSADLYAVFALSSTSAWAVGDSGTFLRYDGNWTAADANTSADLRGVFALDADNVWAVGSGGVILHDDGNTTAVETSNSTDDLFAVFGFDANDTFVGGSAGLVLRRGSGTWAPESTGTNATLRGFWGSAANNLWAVATASDADDPIILHRVGDNNWQAVTSSTAYNDTNTSRAFLAVWGSAATDIWVASDPITHYNGAAWRPDIGAPRGGWRGIGGSGATDIWVVGDLGNIAHRGGQGWTTVTSGELRPVTSDWAVRTMHGANANDLWALNAANEAWHYNGTSWAVADLPQPTGFSAKPKAVWVTASDAWAIGESNASRHVMRYNGVAWGTFSTGSTSVVNDLWASGASDVWLVGAGGSIARGGVTGFHPLGSGTTADILAVFGLSKSSVWVATDSELRHWAETLWESPETLTATPKAIWASSPNDVWVLGTNSIAHCTPNCTQTSLPAITGTLVLDDLWGTSSTNVWAVGNASGTPVILRWQGSSWSRETTSLRGELSAVFAADANTTFVGGSNGVLKR